MRILESLIKFVLIILWVGLSVTLSFFAGMAINGAIVMLNYMLINTADPTGNIFFNYILFYIPFIVIFLIFFVPGFVFLIKMKIFKK